MTLLQGLIGWGILGLVASIIFCGVMLFETGDTNMGRLRYTCFVMLFGGVLSILFTALVIYWSIRQEKARTWWKAIGIQAQAKLIDKPLMDYMRGRYNVSDNVILDLYGKHGKTILPVKEEPKPEAAAV